MNTGHIQAERAEQEALQPITCLDIFILSAEQQGGTLPNALRTFENWEPLRQRSFLAVLRQCIEGSGLLWMRDKKVTDPETFHDFLIRAKNPHKAELPTARTLTDTFNKLL